MFIVLGFTFRSITYFKLFFVCRIGVGNELLSSACENPIVSAIFDEKTVLSLLNCFGTFVKKMNYINGRDYFWALHSILLIHIYPYVTPCHTVFITVALYWDQVVCPPTLFCFLKFVLAILDPFHCHIFFSPEFKFISYTTDTIFEYLSFSKIVLVVLKFYLRVPSSMPVFSGEHSESTLLEFT